MRPGTVVVIPRLGDPMERARVLIVDDDSALCEVNTLILELAGYSVTTSPTTGTQAVAAAVGGQPQVIVCRPRYRSDDPTWQVITHLGTNPQTRSIPVVLIASDARVASQRRSLPNVRRVISAPYELTTFRAAIAACVADTHKESGTKAG